MRDVLIRAAELLKTGIRGKNKANLQFVRVEALPGTRWLSADAETKEDTPRRAVISFGPEHAPLEQRQVAQALEEAQSLVPKPKLVIFAALQFDPEAAKDIDETNWPGVTLLKAQMNGDLVTDDLKKKRSSNESFWLVGQPDITLRRVHRGPDTGSWEVEVHGFDYYNPKSGKVESGGTKNIAMWMLDTDYDGRSLYPRQVFFPMTHIMGLRAFTSQLLCEQVVGRGLRRTSYDIEETPVGSVDGEGKTGLLPFMFKPEYVNVFGVPFSFMPHEEVGEAPPPPLPTTEIKVVEERAEAMQITWPQVVRIEHVLTPKLTIDWAQLPVLKIDAGHIPQLAQLAPTVDGKPDTDRVTEIQLRELAEEFRYQKIIFETARKLFEEEKPAWSGSADFLLGQLIGLVETFVQGERIEIHPVLFSNDSVRRRVLLALSMSRIVQHLKNAIRAENTQSRQIVLDDVTPTRSTGDMRPWYTTRPCAVTRNSHISHCVYDSTWESAEAFWLDHQDARAMVRCWARNDHLGFEVHYMFAGGVAKYRPDFLVRLMNGRILVLEVKGVDTPRDQAKRSAMVEWVEAVNADGRFGEWCCDVSHSPGDVVDIVGRHFTGNPG